jgi:hypothetical protein
MTASGHWNIAQSGEGRNCTAVMTEDGVALRSQPDFQKLLAELEPRTKKP